MQISNDAKLNMADGAYKDIRRATSLRDLLDVGIVKSHVAVPHLAHPSAWSNYCPLRMI
jgi:hypothetical protein